MSVLISVIFGGLAGVIGYHFGGFGGVLAVMIGQIGIGLSLEAMK